jgi:hypothetical protein
VSAGAVVLQPPRRLAGAFWPRVTRTPLRSIRFAAPSPRLIPEGAHRGPLPGGRGTYSRTGAEGCAMNRKKDGSRQLSRDEWRLLAQAYQSRADDLRWLVACSRAALLFSCSQEAMLYESCGTIGFPELPADFPPHLRRARLQAQRAARNLVEKTGPSANYSLTELHCLWETMNLVASDSALTADWGAKKAEEVRPGRAKPVSTNALLAVLSGSSPGVRRKKPGTPGRPALVEISGDALLAKFEESRQPGQTQKDALLKMAEAWLRDQGKRTAGDTVQKVAANLERRLREERRRRREARK